MILSASLLLLATAQRGPVDRPVSDAEFLLVDRLTRKTGLTPLRKMKLARDDRELRIWSGFSWGMIEGFVLGRRGGRWSASRIAYARRRGEKIPGLHRDPVAPPKRGWGALWTELDAIGLRTIPDEASLPSDGVHVDDGTKYLFELRLGTSYRSYYYDNPDAHPRKPSAAKVAKMVRIVARTLPDGRL